jgi:type IV pilus assembly protein PilE
MQKLKKFILKKGFSFIEVCVVLLLISILVSFIYPSYQTYIIHSRRHDGQLALYDLANRLQQYYALEHSYENATLGTGLSTDIKSNNLSSEKWYILRINSQNAEEFNLQATSRGAQAQDKECAILTLDHLGHKGSRRSNDSESLFANRCWEQ